MLRIGVFIWVFASACLWFEAVRAEIVSAAAGTKVAKPYTPRRHDPKTIHILLRKIMRSYKPAKPLADAPDARGNPQRTYKIFARHTALALKRFNANNKKSARRYIREAFRLYRTLLKRDRITVDLESDYDTYKLHYTLLPVLRELGLEAELAVLFAGQILHQIRSESYSYNAGNSWVAATAIELEAFDQTSLADAYNAFLHAHDEFFLAQDFGKSRKRANGVWVEDATIASRMLQYAGHLVSGQKYDPALKILQRALRKFNEKRHPAALTTAIVLMARAYDEKGELDKAESAARRAVKLAQRHELPSTGYGLKDLEKILARGAATTTAGKDVLASINTSLEAGIAKACSGTPADPVAFPELPTDGFIADDDLAQRFAQSPTAKRYVACFMQLSAHLEGMNGPQRPGLNATAMRDVMFVLGVARDQDTASDILVLLSDTSRWTVANSDRALTNALPNNFFKSLPASQRLERLKWFEEVRRFAMFSNAIGGLTLGGAKEWLKPHLRKLMREFNVTYLSAQLGHDLIQDEVAELGLALHSLQETEYTKRVFTALDRWARNKSSEPNQAHHTCHEYKVCGFLAVVEEDMGNRARASKHLGWISSSFMVFHSGASATASEIDVMSNLALLEGARHERAGHYRLAETYYNFAGASAETVLGSKTPLRSLDDIRAADAFSRIAYKTGKVGEAHRITTHLVRAAQKRIKSLSAFGSDLLVRWSARLRGIFETHLASTEVGSNGTLKGGDEEFLAMQYLQATRTAVTFTKLSTRMGRKGGELARAHQDASEALANAYGQLVAAKDAIAKRLLKQIQHLEAQLKQLEVKLRKQDPAYFQHGRLQFITLDALQGLLKPGEAVLSSFSGEDHAYLWLITRDRHTLRRLDVKPAALERSIKALRTRIGVDTAVTDIDALLKVPLLQFYQLYRTVLGGFGDQLDGIDQLIFVPHGAFDGLPIATLLTERPAQPSLGLGELRDVKLPWLIRKMAISIMPSLGSIRVLRQRTTDSAARRAFLGIGNPRFGEGIHVASAPTRAADPRLVEMAALPETETEVIRLAQILQADTDRDLLLSDAASETRIKASSLDHYRIIAFATHGLIAGEVRGLDEPALVLSKPENPTPLDDGLLKASEVIDLKLDADLVLLSACNTASGDGRPGAEGLSGLANAFFYAGARNLMVTHWYIPSDSAVDITVGLMQAKQSDPALGWAQALRHSILNLIDGDGPQANAHPRSWGAHMIVGVSD